MWGVTLDDVPPWLGYQKRQVMFREVVIGFLGGQDPVDPQTEYCKTCRELGEDDCDQCDRTIEVMDV